MPREGARAAAVEEAKGRVSPAPLPRLWDAGGDSRADGGGACWRGGAGGGGGEGKGPLPLVLIADLRLRIYRRRLAFPYQAGRRGAARQPASSAGRKRRDRRGSHGQ